MTRLKFLLVDSDPHRAAALADGLTRHLDVTVAESLDALAASRSGRCVALVADDPGAIRATAERLKNAGLRAKIIAYADDASPHRMVKAISDGAADFLQWPCDTANIIAAANAATASPVG